MKYNIFTPPTKSKPSIPKALLSLFASLSQPRLPTINFRRTFHGLRFAWNWLMMLFLILVLHDVAASPVPTEGIFTQVSSGGFHTCALKTDGSLACWGNNDSGQSIPPAGTFTQVSSGYNHTCALKTDGSLACWGNNGYGQATSPTGSFTQVSSSPDHTCALKIDGTLACWGGAYGTEASQSGSFTQVSGGRGYTCALKTDDSLACWGYNYYGQATPPAGSFTQISSSDYHACAVKTDGSLACWGENNHGEAMPYTAGSFTQVSVGVYHTCALKTDGSLICWGQGSDGKITPPAGSFMQISSGQSHTCALKNDGSVVCWGDNGRGQAMPPTGRFIQFSRGQNHTCALKTDSSLACWGGYVYYAGFPPSGSFTQVSSGDNHTCALKTDGSLACWGYNGDYDGRIIPPSGTFTQVSSGASHTCALKIDGNLACWGYNGEGQTMFPAGNFIQVSSGQSHTCALKTDGSLACWGRNIEGQITYPAGSFTQVSSGWGHTCALKPDGSLVCWGLDDSGQVTMTPSGSFTQISSGNRHTCALRTDGSLACWGNNSDGQATPIDGNFTQISSHGNTTCALKIDGSIICWGQINEVIHSATSVSNNTTPQQPMVTPTILSVGPTIATLDTPTIFTLTGNNLVTGMGFTVADCEQTITDGFSNELAGGTDTQRQFQCTPTGVAGTKAGIVRDSNGEILYNFTVEVSDLTVTLPQIKITSVTTTTATLGAPVTFTVTGTHLKEGMELTLTDCPTPVELPGGSDTQRQFQCTPTGVAGTKAGTVKTVPNGEVLYNFTVEVSDLIVTLPQITSVTPLTATLGTTVIFTVMGTYLVEAMNFTVTDCVTPVALPGGTETQRQFQCTPNNTVGVKDGIIQDLSGGAILYNFRVTITGNTSTTTQSQQPLQPIIFTTPTLPQLQAGDVVDGTYNGAGRQIKVNITIGKQSNLSNVVISAKVENQGFLSNLTIKSGGEIKGGILSGYITNQGLLSDFTFLGATLTGGILAGNIVNNSQVGGKFINVTLAPGTKITGGILEGKIQGDCKNPAVLDKVRIKAGSVLSCVKLGKEVKMDKDVVLRPLIESVTPLQAPLKEATIFTVTGQNLPAGMGFTVADCEHSNDELSGGTSTKREFVCIPQGEAGSKTGLVKDKPKGETLYTFEVEVIAPAIRIESISPLVTTIGSPTVFTVKGQNLPDGLGFTVGDCEHSNYETGEGSSTQRQFLCTQFGDPGKKRGLVKTAPGGEILYTFEVTAELHPRPNVYISTNDYRFSDGDTVEVYISTDMEYASTSQEFYDLYVVVIAPGGNNAFDIPGPGFATDPTPYLTNVQPTAEDDWVETLKYSFVANDSQVGEYQLHALLVPAGAGFPDKKGEIDNIVAQDSVTITYDPTADSVRKNTQNGNTTRANNGTTREVQIPSSESLTRSRFTRSAVTTAMKIAMVVVKKGIGIFNKKKDVEKRQANLQSAFDYYDALGDELDDNQKELLFAAKVLELVYNNVDKVTGAKVWKAVHLADGVKRVFELYNENFKEIAAYDNGFSVTLSFYHTWFSSWDERDLSVRVRPVVLYDPTSQFTGSNPTSLEDISIYPSTAIEGAKHYFTEDIADFEVKSDGGSHELTGAVPLPGLYVVMVTDKSTGLQYKQVHLFDKLGQEIYIYIDY